MLKSIRKALLFSLAILLMACQNSDHQNQEKESEVISTKSTSFGKNLAEYAHRFELYQNHNNFLLIVNQELDNQETTFNYIIKGDDSEIPDSWASLDHFSLKKVNTKFATTSTTHIGFLEAIEKPDYLYASTGVQYIYNDHLFAQYKSGAITPLSSSGSLEAEVLIDLKPDILLYSAYSSKELGIINLLKKAGIPTLLFAEWRENTPLGRAEWIKVVGLLAGELDIANKKFEEVATAYHKAAQKCVGIHKKLVIDGLPYKGTWYIAGQESYFSNLIQDAGGEVNWEPNKATGSIPSNLEGVLPFALEAEVWINPGAAKTIDDIKKVDQRLAELPVIKTTSIYNNTKRVHPERPSNDYWQSGVTRPDLILKDFIFIIHPDILPNHEFFYYENIAIK